MNLRLGVGAALLVVGLALAGLGLSQHGKPWGFRGHAAALLEATHNVELVPSPARAEREHLDDALLPQERGTFLDAGDGVRVGVHSEARLVLPGGALVVGDATRVTLTDKGARLAQGSLEVTVARGAPPLVVALDAPPAELRLRAAESDGVVRILADGKGAARVHVRAGSVEAASGAAAQTATEGKVLVLGADKSIQVEDPPTALAVSAVCVERRVSVSAPPATQLFVDGVVQWPDSGQVTVATSAEHPNRAHVFGRDVVGNVAPVAEVACSSAPPPSPGNALPSPPRRAPPPPAPKAP